MSEQYIVRIIEDATGNVVKQLEPTSERQAGKLASAVSINLNHDDYSVEVVSVSEAKNG